MCFEDLVIILKKREKEKRRENSNNPLSHRANLAIRPFVEEIEIQPRKYAIILSTFFFFVFFLSVVPDFSQFVNDVSR